jgi:prepilin signal peptidase PulO-like enzyme (type II secretory pathway)
MTKGLYALFCLALICVGAIDARTRRIPWQLNLLIGILGALRLLLDESCRIDGMIGFFVPSLLLGAAWLWTKGGGIGSGDVKLMAVSGLMLGWRKNVLAFLIGSIGAVILRLLYKGLLYKSSFYKRPWKTGEKFAFGPCLSAGIMLSLIFGTPLIRAYSQWNGLPL